MAERKVIESYVEVAKLYPLAEGEDRFPAPGEMWVMRDGNGVVQAVNFRCPCGCGAECFTPILEPGKKREEAKRPIWDYSPGPTLSPSIRYTGGCKAHFTITNGKVAFSGDSGK